LATDSVQPDDLVFLLRAGEAPREVRQFAARGLLPLDREGQIRGLLAVYEDPDAEIAAEAAETLAATPPDELTRFVSDGASEDELDVIARACQDPFVLEQVIRDRNVGDHTLEGLARTVTGAPQEALVVNQVRLLRQPSLIEALFENPDLTSDARRRLNEIREEFFDKQIRREVAREEAEVRAAEEADRNELAAEVEKEEAARSAEEQEALDESLTTGAVYRRIAIMTVSEKIKLAYAGGKEERRVLIGDANRLVGLAVMKSRGLTVNEIETFCSMRQLDTEIFRKIGENREWIRKPAIAAALVKNPKVPLAITLPLVKHLPVRDLKSIVRDPNLPEGLRITARKLLTDKRR
jgi:hypothetical protein